jgi:hypothetical protein
MSIEIVFEIAGDNPAILSQLAKEAPEAQVDYISGMGGLEILGTLAIPSLALALQILSMIRDRRDKQDPASRAKDRPAINLFQVHIYNGDQHIRLTDCADGTIENAIKEAVAKLT